MSDDKISGWDKLINITKKQRSTLIKLAIIVAVGVVMMSVANTMSQGQPASLALMAATIRKLPRSRCIIRKNKAGGKTG
jgi:hypothetical protein